MTVATPDTRPLSGPSRRAGMDDSSVVIISAVALTVLAFALTAADWGGERLVWENLHWTISMVAAAVLGYLGYRDAPADERRARGLIFTGLMSYAVGQLAWLVQVALDIVTVPAVSDIFFLGAALPIAAGFWVMLRQVLTPAERTAFLVDSIAVVIVLALFAQLAFGTSSLISDDPVAGFVLLAYPVTFLAAAGVAALAALQLGLWATPWGVTAMIVGLGATGVAWVLWMDRAVTELPPPGSPVNYLFSIAWLMVGIGANRLSLRPHPSPFLRRLGRVVLASFPIVTTAIALAVLLSAHLLVSGSTLELVRVGAALVIVPAMLRQALLLRELSSRATREQQLRVAEHTALERAESALAAQSASESRYRDVVEVFARLAEQLSFAADESNLVRAALAALRRLVPSSAGDVLLANASQDRLVSWASWGEREHVPVGQPIEDQPPVRCLGIRRGSLYAVRDAADELTLPCPVYPSAHGSTLCVPLLALGQTIGVIHLATDEPNGFDADSERQASRIAEQVALAIANARLMRTMESMALTDPLTSIHNARFFDPFLERELATAERDGKPLGLVLIDLDHFKRFNDTYGHQAGDEALRTFARATLGVLRDSDTLARYGGEEFVVAVRDADDEAAAEIAERMREAVERASVEIGVGNYASFTASFGVTSTQTHGFDRLVLMKKADAALYQAKRQGRNQVVTSRPRAASRQSAAKTA